MRAPDRFVLGVVKSFCLEPTYRYYFMANHGNLLITALVTFCSYRYVALWVCCSPGIQPQTQRTHAQLTDRKGELMTHLVTTPPHAVSKLLASEPGLPVDIVSQRWQMVFLSNFQTSGIVVDNFAVLWS